MMTIGEGDAPQPRNWVEDNCSSGFIWPLTPERARGILRIHASCTPPCPRSRAATDYLNTLESA